MSQITVTGPWLSDPMRALWRANVNIVRLEWLDPNRPDQPIAQSAEVRELLTEANDLQLFPRLGVLRGRIISVQVRRRNEPAVVWTGNENSAHEALLLVSPDDDLHTARCLAGDIPLDRIDPSPDNPSNWARLFFGAALENVTAAHATASGLVVEADGVLPWQDERVHGAYLATYPFATDQSGALSIGTAGTAWEIGALRVEPDRQRWSQPQRADLLAALKRFTKVLRPRPALLGAQPREPWVMLEPAADATIDTLPYLHWRLTGNGPGTPAVQAAFEPAEMRLVITGQDGRPRAGSAGGISELTAAVDVSIALQSGNMVLELRHPNDPAVPLPPDLSRFIYEAAEASGRWGERWRLEGDHPLTLDALALAANLRAQHGVPEPRVVGTNEPIKPAVLWGALATNEGWAQLPFLNVTAEGYVKAGIAEVPDSRAPLLQGEAEFGNAGLAVEGEQRWSIGLRDARRVTGTWSWQRAGSDWQLSAVALRLVDPTCSLDGFIWLGTAGPTVADALPATDDYVAGYESLFLRTPAGDTRYPSPHRVSLRKLAWASEDDGHPKLDPWQADLVTAPPIFNKLVQSLYLEPRQTLADFQPKLPLAWRRAAPFSDGKNLPHIQNLPWTQNQSPASHPSTSRSLAPFALPAFGAAAVYSFGNDEQAPAKCWPHLLTAVSRLPEWTGLPEPGLTLAGLSAPGLYWTAEATGADLLAPRYAFGLPYLDELNAFARLPKDSDAEEAESQKTDPARGQLTATERPVVPLRREDYQEYWEQLSEKAFLALADAEHAARIGDATARVPLVEPLAWPATAQLDPAYPGTITFAERGAPTRQIALQGATALRGLQGKFTRTTLQDPDIHFDPTGAGPIEVVAHSMAALYDGAEHSLRDQRGWSRSATTGSDVLRTPLRFETTPGTTEQWELLSMLAPAPITVAGKTWHFWARDLPCHAGVFAPRGPSPHAADVNDPAALGRDRVPLTGYEWRLAPEGLTPQDSGGWLPLFGCPFLPLRLAAIQFTNTGAISRLEIEGRLQAPQPQPREHPEHGCRVRVAFGPNGGGGLALQGLAEVSAGTWPLSKEEHGPRVTWEGAHLTSGLDGLVLSHARLRARALDASWTTPAADFVLRPGASEMKWTIGTDLGDGLRAVEAVAELDLQHLPGKVSHEAKLTIGVTWGESAGLPFVVEATIDLINDDVSFRAGFGPNARWAVDDLAVRLASGALQLSWKKLRAPDASEPPRQLLPGWHLDTGADSPGHAIVAFALTSQADDLPVAKLNGAAFEGLLTCGWHGGGLQSVAANTTPSADDLFGSSAGHVVAALTIERTPGRPWDSSLLLNGWCEVKNLVSWPLTGHTFAAAPLATFTFAFNDSTPPADTAARLRDLLQAHPGWDLLLEGHADKAGSVAANAVLATERAEAVYAVLQRIDPAVARRARVVSHGEGRAAEGEDTPGAPDCDRRVEVWPQPRFVRPPSRGAGGSDFAHLRHSMRFLFEQHVLPSGLLAAGGAMDGWLVNLAAPWSLLAIAQHEIAAIRFDPPNLAPLVIGARHRWTVVQPTRIMNGEAWRQELAELAELTTLAPAAPIPTPNHWDKARRKLAGFLSDPMVRAVASLTTMPPLVVEAGNPLWLRTTPLPAEGGSATIASLPGFATAARLTSEADFDQPHSYPFEQGPAWLLWAFPFLGRFQPMASDEIASAPPAPEAARLGPDPVLALWRLRTGGVAGPALWRMLASREDLVARAVRIEEFDLGRSRRWRRLEAKSLRESWFRLHHTGNPARGVAESALASVMASLPVGSPAELCRPGTLRRAFDPERAAWPPRDAAPRDETFNPGTAVLQGFTAINGSADPFVVAGACLLSAVPALSARASGAPVLLSAAAIIADLGARGREPVSLAVSPCATVEAHEAADAGRRVVTLVELLVLDPKTGRLGSVASQTWPTTLPAGAVLANLISLWADKTRRGLGPDARLALLRQRDVARAASTGGADIAITTFSFQLLDPGAPPPAAPGRHALRPAAATLAFAEGQFAGTRLPLELTVGGYAPMKVAPPQVTGVQPIHLDSPAWAPRPGWSFAAMYQMVRTAAGDAPAIVGPPAQGRAARRWWMGLRSFAQFALPAAASQRRLLPSDFRAAARRTWIPQPPDLPWPVLPMLDPLALPATYFQPLLPAGWAAWWVGSRPGVPFVFNHRVFEQSGAAAEDRAPTPALGSGGLAVQHRMPRPVTLPPNAFAANAMPPVRTWGSEAPQPADAGAFHHHEEAHVSVGQPSDNAWFNLASGARSLTLILDRPKQARTSLEQGVKFTFEQIGDGDWNIAEPLLLTPAGGLPLQKTGLEFTLKNALPSAAAAWPDGTLLVLELGVEPQMPAGQPHGYRQRLRFPLRLDRSGPEEALPLQPVFVQFEDPEYNRALASGPAEQRNGPFALFADRRRCNPDSSLVLLYQHKPGAGGPAVDVKLFRRRDGVESTIGGAPAIQLQPNEAAQVELASFPLIPGDLFVVKLLTGTVTVLELAVPIVSEPVIPPPPAAYALLRAESADGGQLAAVATARFAWNPPATRIELVDVADLTTPNVRRRGVFQWEDTIRHASATRHAIQKIHVTGATHFPAFA
jgi:hypothetical protein